MTMTRCTPIDERSSVGWRLKKARSPFDDIAVKHVAHFEPKLAEAGHIVHDARGALDDVRAARVGAAAVEEERHEKVEIVLLNCLLDL
jgi:hypothetical protein